MKSEMSEDEPEHFDARKAYLILSGNFMKKLIERLRDPLTSSEAATARHEAAEALDYLTKKIKLLEKVEMYLRTNTPEESGYYFIAGALGEVDQNRLPKELLICPAYGVDWMQIYTRTERTTGPEW